MAATARRFSARVHGRSLEVNEDIPVPDNAIVNVVVELPSRTTPDALERALDASAGAWTDENHPDLVTVDDIRNAVRKMRAGFGRHNG